MLSWSPSARRSQQVPETQLLWEVGCEELPAWACEQVLDQLPGLITRELEQARLDTGAELQVWVGPRRFAVQAQVAAVQREHREEARGPAYDAAFRDGQPTPAGAGFARSKGIEPDQLEVREHEGRRFVFATVQSPSRPLHEVFPEIAARVLSQLSFGKAMRWGSGAFRFVRPVRWLLTKSDEQTIEYELMGVRSGGRSRTHRFLGDARDIEVPSAGHYRELLTTASVMVDHAERRQRIGDALDAAASAAGGTWFDPADVLDEVVHLVEWPSVIEGAFAQHYLELPERVLVTAMQAHQRYLPVRNGDSLLPRFLTVMNGDPAAIEHIRPGYERVLEGRLDDAVFSVQRDHSRGIESMAESLDAVVFHARAGSLADRTQRLRALIALLADPCEADTEEADTAARLAKADQVSGLVQEFAELEGFAGSLYAKRAGHSNAVCAALAQQYLPDSADAALPEAGLPSALALADKFDLLATAFSIGEQPTGSRDPHGLRRAALGIVRIVLEHDLPVDVHKVVFAGVETADEQGFGGAPDKAVEQLLSFLHDRLERQLLDDGVRVDAVRAARAAQLPRLQQVAGLARALDAAVRAGDERFMSVLTAVKRCARIVAKADASEVAEAPDPELFEAEAEREVSTYLEQLRDPVREAVLGGRYDQAVAEAARLGPAVDAFFDRDSGVMVMAEKRELRSNRLALVRSVVTTLEPLGDLAELQT